MLINKSSNDPNYYPPEVWIARPFFEMKTQGGSPIWLFSIFRTRF